MKPRLHLQSLAASLPTAESEAAGQLAHVGMTLAPNDVIYNPRLHLQSLTASLPAAESEAAGQLPHVLDVDAPVAAEKVPLGQSLHATQPDASLNLPGVHALHPTIEPMTPDRLLK